MAAEAIAAIGDNTIDIYTGRDEHSFVGGNAVNVAVQLTLLGRPARYLGAVGPDDAGERIRRTLAMRGVDVAGLVTLPGRTSTSRIRVDQAGVRHFEYEDFAVCDDYAPDAAALESAAECGAVHLGLLSDAEPVRAYLADRGVLVSQDCGVTRPPRCLTRLAIAFCSQEAAGRSAHELATEAIAAGARLAVVTCGADGSVAFDGHQWWQAAAVPTNVVDTTGAGDSYAAGFLHARLAGADVDQAMRAGSQHAARACTHHGGWPQQALPPPQFTPR
jgi:fructoselysine 6-kinase